MCLGSSGELVDSKIDTGFVELASGAGGSASEGPLVRLQEQG